MRQPAVFFGHGSPMNALGGPFRAAWRELGEAIGKPEGVVMISAHWETRWASRLRSDRKPSMISVTFRANFTRCSIQRPARPNWRRGWPS